MKNGVVLIDEIETGLDYSSLLIAWKAIFIACKEYNVQLIATTHSYECIQALSSSNSAIEPDGDDIRLYRLEKSSEIHKAIKAKAQMIKISIEKEFEVR
jgi:AAA15 family ATPase/GTPase